MPDKSSLISFNNNQLLSSLFGEHDKNLAKIETSLTVTISSRGNELYIQGKEKNVTKAENILKYLYTKLEEGNEISEADIDAALRISDDPKGLKESHLFEEEIIIKTAKKQISPYSVHQKKYIKELFNKDLVFATGPAGTGKTYLAVAVAASMFLNNRVERIILCRPAVEAGEKIGFLPGDLKDKVDPYMQPLYDALYDMFPSEKVQKFIESRIFEIAPLAFMRGRTLKNAFIILDEAQNATMAQMKMFLTRMGEGAKMAINGDLTQIDLPNNSQSGLDDALNRLRDIEEIGYIKFSEKDIVRHSLVAKIVRAYSKN